MTIIRGVTVMRDGELIDKIIAKTIKFDVND